MGQTPLNYKVPRKRYSEGGCESEKNDTTGFLKTTVHFPSTLQFRMCFYMPHAPLPALCELSEAVSGTVLSKPLT